MAARNRPFRDTLTHLLGRTTEPDWEAAYAAELPRVYNYFRYRVGDDWLAEDLTAATFERAWRHRRRYRADLGAFSTWLFTIARRLAADHFRSTRPEAPLEAAEAFHRQPTPEETLAQRDDHRRLGTLLTALPERQRELVALKYGAGLTNRQIAAQTGLSETNVGTLLHRAVQTLRLGWKSTEECIKEAKE